MKRLRTFIYTFALVGTMTSFSHAETDVVVTGSRIPVPAHQIGSAVTVISSEELRRLQPSSLAEVLRTVPGIAVDQSGARGSLTQVRIRGAEGNQTLVLVDGIKMNDPGRGSEFNFANFPLADIERIEIVRGPQSSVWGSDAIGGVIHIITRAPKPGFHSQARAEGGAYNTESYQGSLSGGSKTIRYLINLARFHTDGFSSANERRGNTEKDGYTNKNALVRVQATPTEALKIDFIHRLVLAETETDGFQGGVGAVDANELDKSRQYYSGINVKHQAPQSAWQQQLSINQSENQIDSFSSGVSSFSTLGKRTKGSYQVSYLPTQQNSAGYNQQLTGVIENEREKMRTTFSGGERQIFNDGYALEYRFNQASQWFGSLAVRYDDNDTFKNASTYRLTAAWVPKHSSTRWHSSLGTGVKNPTLFELFGSTSTFTGNPNLKPEQAQGWDIGVERQWLKGKIKTDVTWYQLNTDSLIQGSGNTAINLDGTTKAQGVELTARATLNRLWTLSGSFTTTDAHTASGAVLVRRPKYKTALNILYQPTPRWSVNLNTVYNQKVYDFAFDSSFNRTTVSLDDYVVSSLNVGFKANKHWRWNLRVENLFDEKYEEVYTYGTSRRALYLGMETTF